MVATWLLTEVTVTSVSIKIQHYLVISLACEYMYIHLALLPVQSRPRDFFFLWGGSNTGNHASLPVAEDVFVTRSNEGWLYSQAGYISLHNTSFYILIVSQRLTGARDIRGFKVFLSRAHNLYNAGLLLISCPIFLMRPFTSGHANIYLVE